MRKESQLSLPDDFSGLDFTIPSRMSHSALIPVLQQGQTAVRGSVKFFYTRRGQSKQFQHFRSHGKSRRLIAAVM